MKIEVSFKIVKTALAFIVVVSICSVASYRSFHTADNGKLFHLLSPKQTNIQFNNQLADTKDHNILIYSNFYGGAGVAAGDINNDGLADLYFAGNQVGDQLYLNKGNMVFEDITESAGIVDNGGWSSGVLLGDVNGDGYLDIYVTRELYDDEPELRRNKLYINNGDQTFREEARQYGVDNDQRTRHATFLDYDKDGDLDLFLLNQPPNPGDYSKFAGTELLIETYQPKLYELQEQRYVDVTAKAGLQKTGFPNSVTASDLNGDGWTDLYVANDFWAGDWYYINNGDGTFTDVIHENLRHTSFSSMGVDAGDINNDGRLDMIVVDMVAEDNYRLKANMSGMNPKAFWKVVDEGGHHQYMFNMLQLNIGEGQFSDIAQLGNVASTDWSWTALMADLDNDGWKDIYITNGLMRDIRNNDASKAFAKHIQKAVYEHLQKNPDQEITSLWEVVDIDETLALTPSEKLQNYVFRNNGDLTFSKKMSDWGLEEKTFSNGSAYADLDNDGDLDLIVNNINDQAMIYENQSSDQQTGNFLRIRPIADAPHVTEMGTKVWIETRNGTQFYELTGVRGMYSTSEYLAHFGLGQLEVVDQLRIQWSDGQETLRTNVKANQLLEVKYSASAGQASAEIGSPPESLLENITEQTGLDYRHEENKFDDYVTQVLLPQKMSTLGPALAVGDVDNDGLEDFFVGGSAGKPGALFRQRADGGFEEAFQEVLAREKIHEDVGAAFFDLENDGDLDLYVVSGGNEFNPTSDSYHDRLYLNDGNGHFSSGEDRIPGLKISGSGVFPNDFDRDGDVDLLITGHHVPWAYPEPTSSILLENRDGHLIDVTTSKAPELIQIGMVNEASWFDYDGDGWEDVVLAGEWMPMTIFRNDQGKLHRVSAGNGLAGTEGWWFSVTTADLDLDGDLDILGGNLGLNYKYKATPEEPFEVYYYDFDENGKKDIVLTYYNFGIQYPLRGRQCSSEQVPMLKEKFETYDIFASSDATQVYGKENLENALNLQAHTFGSAYFENRGDGTFEMHLLPQEAQVSSINDFVIQDVNADDLPDVLLAGNLYNAEVETARNDAGFGLLLLNRGAEGFEAIDRLESGFFLPYNVKQLRLLGGEKVPMVVAASNDERIQIFQQR